jgi:hypothetical protein
MSTTALNPLGLRARTRGGEVSGGIVDHNVESAKRLQHFLDDCHHLVVTPHVADSEDGLNPGLPQRRNGRLQAVFFSAADGDARAVAAQAPARFPDRGRWRPR